jgi:hypothetical protein
VNQTLPQLQQALLIGERASREHLGEPYPHPLLVTADTLDTSQGRRLWAHPGCAQGLTLNPKPL